VPFEIIWSESALKDLKKMDRTVSRRIFDTVTILQDEPYRNVIRLANSPYYRLRVGDHRIILDIQDERMRVLIIKVGHRKNIYQ
jgi:mRNA interferase RelE/StbE